jgi:hypothetical protein
MAQAITPLTPTVTGAVSAYAISPALPSGLSLNTSTGVISGTPTTVTAPANYTTTASNASGSTTAPISLAVNAIAPSIGYNSNRFTLTAGEPAQGVTPSNSGGAVVAWSISPAILPAGLTFSTVTGSIGGTPTVATAPAQYVVAAENSGGKSTASLTLGVQAVLFDLIGHTGAIVSLQVTSSRVLSVGWVDNHVAPEGARSAKWILWDSATSTKLASGVSECELVADSYNINCAVETPYSNLIPYVALKGPIMVNQTVGGLEVRSSTDGSLLSALSASVAWWTLASDGSYVCAGSAAGLTVWSPSGTVISSRAGDYSRALVFAAPGQVQVALGPAGANVVETVALPSGASSLGPAFAGLFNSWFLDGQHFLTTAGDTVGVYTSAGVRTDLTTLPTTQSLGGQGSWFWSNDSTLNIYKVGASTAPAATFPASGDVVASGPTLGLLGAGIVVDLSGSTLATTTFVSPVPVEMYGAASASQWLFGNQWGVVVDGQSLGGTPRYFGYGAAWSIAGSPSRVVVGTASGRILYVDAATGALEGTINNFSSNKLALSSDGTILAASNATGNFGGPGSLIIYSLPSGAVTSSFSYPCDTTGACLFDFTLSGSGTALGLATYDPSIGCTRQVSALTGGAVLWSDTLQSCQPIRLSPDGSEVAVADTKSATSGTKIYAHGTLVTAVPGWVVGWLDDSRILVNNYNDNAIPPDFAGASIYSSSGIKLGDLANSPFPELPRPGVNNDAHAFDIVSADSVYDPSSNAVYSTVSGMATWTSDGGIEVGGIGAIAGANVVFASDNRLLSQPY